MKTKITIFCMLVSSLICSLELSAQSSDVLLISGSKLTDESFIFHIDGNRKLHKIGQSKADYIELSVNINAEKSKFTCNIKDLIFPTVSVESQHATNPGYKSTDLGKNTTSIEKGNNSDSVVKHVKHVSNTARDIDFYFTIGLSFDKDYSNYITEAFESNGRSLSGFTGWINLGIGLEFKITKNFYLSTSALGRFSRIGITDQFTNATSTRYINGLYSFGLGGAFYIPVGKTAFYLNGKLLANLSGSDSELEKYDFKYETKGIGLEGSVGWKIFSGKANSVSFELGYSAVPVSIEQIYSSFYQFYNESDEASKKIFGRIFFNIRGSFGLLDY